MAPASLSGAEVLVAKNGYELVKFFFLADFCGRHTGHYFGPASLNARAFGLN